MAHKNSSFREKQSDSYTIYGRVTYSDTNLPAEGIHIIVMDADLFFKDKFGETVTDKDGKFNISFEITQFRKLVGKSPDIYLVINDKEGDLLTDTRDSVIRKFGHTQEIHVQLPSNKNQYPIHTISVGGIEVDKKVFDSLKPDDVLAIARSSFSAKPDEKVANRLKALHPSLSDELLHPKLCNSLLRRVLFDIIRVKKWKRDIMIQLEETLIGNPWSWGFTSYSCPPFNIYYDTTGSNPVSTVTSSTNITIPGTSIVVGNTTGTAGSPPNYIQRLCFWLQRAYQIYTNPPYNLRTPGGGSTITVYVNDPSFGHGSDTSITMNWALSDNLLAWVAVHEMMHCIQDEYVSNGTAGGWNPGMVEGGAVMFGEDSVLDPINRYAAEADCFFGEGTLRHPENSLKNESYKLSLFLKYIAEQQSPRVNSGDEPTVGVDTYRKILETFDIQGYNTAAFQNAIRELPWYQDLFDFWYLDAARLDETSSETILGNFWAACYLKDFGIDVPDRRFDFMEDEESSLADDIHPSGATCTINTLRSIVLQNDLSLTSGLAITLSSGGGTVSPFASRLYKIRPDGTVNTLRVSFSASSGFTRPIVQVILVGPGNTVRDILRTDSTNWNRTIANDRSGTRLDHILIIVSGTDTGGSFNLSVQDVPASSDVMVTRWHHVTGTHYEIDSFNWAWTWISPDIWVDNNMDGIADDLVYFNQNNKLFIRLHNQGNLGASNIHVDLWYQDASGGLSDSAWIPVKNAANAIQTLDGLSLGPQSSNQWSVDWAPIPSGSSHHFCIRAVVTVPSDPNIDNKRCLSNFGNVVVGIGGFVDLELVRRPYLERYEKVEVVVIPRTHRNIAVSKGDLDEINRNQVKVGTEVTDLLRIRRRKITEHGGEKSEEQFDLVKHLDKQLCIMKSGQTRLERRPDPDGDYPTNPLALPPGMETAEMITIANLVNGKPIGGFTWAIREK